MRRRPPRSTLFPYTALFRSEKAARGMRHVKRAVRGDLHRFKAFIEMAEQETGAWRGVIEDGELVEEHDPSYDEEREYSDVEDFVEDDEDSDEESGEESDEGGNGGGGERTERFKPQAERTQAGKRDESDDDSAGSDESESGGSSRRSRSSSSRSGSSSGRSRGSSKAKPQGRRRSTGR